MIMASNAALEKVCDNRRQLCDNFATTKKEQKTNKNIDNIYIYIEVVATFLVVSTPIVLPPLLGGLFVWVGPTTFYPLYRDNRKRQLFSDNRESVRSHLFVLMSLVLFPKAE